jgi:hypothetical protein
MDKLSLEQKREARESPLSSTRAPRVDMQPAKATTAAEASGKSSGDHHHHQQQLKRRLTKINKQLKEIAKLEDAEAPSLSTQQEQKLARKSTLQQQRNEIIAELNGATVTRSSGSATRTRVAINL